MALGSILAVGALAILGIGGAVIVAQLLSRRDSVAASAEKALSQGVRDALGDVVGRLLPRTPSFPALPGIGGTTTAGQAGQQGLSQVTSVLSGVGGVAQGLGSLISSIGGIANVFGGGGAGSGGGSLTNARGLAGGASSVFSGDSMPASALDRDFDVVT